MKPSIEDRSSVLQYDERVGIEFLGASNQRLELGSMNLRGGI